MCIQKTSILPFILLVLIQLPSAAAQAVPPPLPESQWVNRTSLNYTELHDKYAAGFQCMYYPTGVYGFYYGWIVELSMILTLYATFSSDRMEGRFFPILNFLSSLPPTAFSLFLLNQNIRAFSSCEIYSLNKQIHQLGIFGNVTAGMWAAGSIAYLITTGLNIENWAVLIIKLLGWVLLTFGMLMQFVFIGTNYRGILDSLKINTTKPDMVSPGARVAIFVPFGIILVVGNLASLWTWCKRASRDQYGMHEASCLHWLPRLVATVAAILAGVYHGISALRIGNIIGDPWGGYSIQGLISIMDAVMAGTVPVLQLLLLYACKKAGKLAED